MRGRSNAAVDDSSRESTDARRLGRVSGVQWTTSRSAQPPLPAHQHREGWVVRTPAPIVPLNRRDDCGRVLLMPSWVRPAHYAALFLFFFSGLSAAPSLVAAAAEASHASFSAARRAVLAP